MPVVFRGGASVLGTVDGGRDRHLHSHGPALDKAHMAYEKEQARFVDSLRPPLFVDRLAEPAAIDSNRRSGRERLNSVRTILDSFGLERSEMQKQFHEDMIGACARLIFKDDLESELDDLLLELGCEKLHSEFMAITPRRFGKTYSVAMFVIAMLLSIEGLEQAIFSTGRRASVKLKELAYRFLCSIPGMKENVIQHNIETIWVRGPYGDQDVRKVFFYPSNVKISFVCLCLCLSVFVCTGARVQSSQSVEAANLHSQW